MPKLDYISQNDVLFATQLQTFKTNAPAYATVLGLTTAQLNAQTADADYFQYVAGCLQIMQDTAQQWTSWKNDVRIGHKTLASGEPVVPALLPAVTAVDAGVENRFRALVKLVKASPGYNSSIGEALGIEGAEQTGPDLASLKPTIQVRINGAHVDVLWGWDGHGKYLDLAELQVDRGNGWEMLAFDTTPNYTDTNPFPSSPVKWKYRLIYRVGDQRVGQWSDETTITVGG